MTLNELDLNGTYSYADYLRWTFDEYVELIRGKIFKMAAPNRRHQSISREIFVPIVNFFKKSDGQVFMAPFDVRLTRKDAIGNEQIFTVVQPDIVVVCDPSKLDERGCIGAPDLVVEILSPSTSHKDLVDKKSVYEEAGIQEYWIVHPNDQTLIIYSLNAAGEYVPGFLFTKGQTVKSHVLAGFELNLDEVFED